MTGMTSEKESSGVLNESMVIDVIKVEVPTIKSNTETIIQKDNSTQNRDDIWNNVLSKINKMTKILLDNEDNKRMLETAFANVM
jgi:hypothetical protein